MLRFKVKKKTAVKKPKPFKVIAVRCKPGLHKRMLKMAKSKGMSVNRLGEEIIEQAMDQLEK